MRSFQKKLTATAAGAALIAALGIAYAQSTPSSDPLDAHSAVADPNQPVSQSTSTKTINGADRSTNGPLTKTVAAPSDQSQTTSAPPATSSTMSTDNSSSTPADTSSANSSSADSSTAAAPAPRADRN